MLEESPTREQIAANLTWLHAGELALEATLAGTSEEVNPDTVKHLGELLEEASKDAHGLLLDFLLHAQRMVTGSIGMVCLTGLKEGRPEAELEAFEPYIICTSLAGPSFKGPDGDITHTMTYPELGRGKSYLQAAVRAVIYIGRGKSAWTLTRSGRPSDDCWVTWRDARWALDGMVMVREDHIPTVKLKWMDPEAATTEQLDGLADGELVPMHVTELNASFGVFTTDDGRRFVGPHSLAHEWRAHEWRCLTHESGRVSGVVLDDEGSPMAYVMPVTESDVEEEVTTFKSPGGMLWTRSEEGAKWTAGDELVYLVDDGNGAGWWRPDVGPYENPFAAMCAADPGPSLG